MPRRTNHTVLVNEKWQCPSLMCDISEPHYDANFLVFETPDKSVPTIEIKRFAPTNNAFVGHNVWLVTSQPPIPLKNRTRVYFHDYGTVTLQARKEGGLQVPGWAMFEGLDDDGYRVISLVVVQAWTTLRPPGQFQALLRRIRPHRRTFRISKYL